MLRLKISLIAVLNPTIDFSQVTLRMNFRFDSKRKDYFKMMNVFPENSIIKENYFKIILNYYDRGLKEFAVIFKMHWNLIIFRF